MNLKLQCLNFWTLFSYFIVHSRVKHRQISHRYLKAYTLVAVNYRENLNTSFAVRFELFMVQIVTELLSLKRRPQPPLKLRFMSRFMSASSHSIMCQKMFILTCFIICSCIVFFLVTRAV